MWKYKCRNQVISLVAAFLLGVLMMVFMVGDSSSMEMVAQVLPSEYLKVYQSNPYLIYLSGGLAVAGICNIYLIGSVLMNQFGVSPFIWFLLLMMMPSYVIAFGMLTVPVMLIISLYGWISLVMKNRGLLRSRSISSDDEIVRIYTIHHPLNEKYKQMALSIRRSMTKVSLIYALGIVAILCVMIFVDNIFLTVIAIFAYMFCFQYLSSYRTSLFMPIANLLYQDCDPEACMSALIYYSQHGSHYRLTNQALMANCLIYLDDPSLAQDVLISYPRGNSSQAMTYWSLMAYTYYLLKDENGLERCKEAISKIKPRMGAMSVMLKSNEQASVENKIQLMNRNFQQCKQYYLDVLKRSQTKLQQADCDYYIALISFVQEDYPLARLYFEKTIRIGNKLYFVRNAKNYLAKIEEIQPNPIDEIPYERYS